MASQHLIIREPGFYKVRRFHGGRLEPAEWSGKEWFTIGDMPPLYDADFVEIGERLVMEEHK